MNSEQIDAMNEAARAAMKAGIHVGHLFVKQDQDDLLIRCTLCSAEELVKNFSNGGQPQKFVYQPIRTDGREYVKCEKCGSIHDRVIPHAR